MLVFLGVSGVAAPLAAQAPRVERQGAFRRELQGTSVTVVFRATGSAEPTALQGSIELPPGWRAITPELPFTLGSAETDLRLVGIAVPASTPAGSYLVRYIVRPILAGDGGGVVPVASDSIVIVVPARRRLELQLSESPGFVAAGNQYTTAFLLTNRGNAPTRVRLELQSGASLPARTDSAYLELVPGEVRTIPVTVTTPLRLAAKLQHRLELRAIATADITVRDSTVSLVEVIPRSGVTSGGEQHLPVTLKLRGSPHGAAAPFEVSGAGPLGKGGASIAFFARGSGARDGAFGERDDYRIDFRSRTVDLRFGDQVYILSPLTGQGHFGFGGSGRLALGPLVARGFVQWDRRAGFRRSAQGGSLGLRPVRAVELGVNYLARPEARSPLWSARAQLFPAAWQTIDLEYGLGTGRLGGTRSVTLYGSQPHWSYEVRHLRTDSAYREPSGLASQDFASVAIRPWRLLRLEGSAGATERFDTATATLLPSSFAQRLYRAELGYGAASVEYRKSEQRGTAAFDGLARVSESVVLRVGLRARRSWLQPVAEFGRVKTGGDEDRTPFRRLGVTAGVQDGRGNSASISVESFHGRRAGSNGADEYLVAGANAALALTRTTRLRVMSQGIRSGGAVQQLSGLLDATVEQDLPWGHTVSARARLFKLGGMVQRSQSAFVFEYTLPLQIPLPGASGTRLGGRVYDAESREGVPNAVVRVGERVVLTDQSGRWSFSDVEPGTQRVLLDSRSLAPGQVALETAPLEVAIAQGERSRLDLGVTRAARLTGRVLLFEFASNASLAAGQPDLVGHGGVAGLVIELVSGTRVARRVTDAEGGFDFSDLSAGQWTASVTGSLPEQHYLERDSVDLAINPERLNDLSLRVLPTVRRVQMLTQGEVSLEAARPMPAPVVSKLTATSAPTTPQAGRRYTVTRLDVSLMSVARSVYRDAALWPKLWVANRHQLSSPNTILPGQVLLIPDSAPLTQEEIAEARAYRAGLRSGSTQPLPPVLRR